MQQEDLKAAMKYLLSAATKNEITDETIHQDVLSSRSIRNGIPSTKNQYQNFVRQFLLVNQPEKKKAEADKPWPADWMKLSVAQLAQSLLVLMLFISISLGSVAQVDMNISAIKTDLKDNAIKIGIKYLQQWDSLFQMKDIFGAKKHSLHQFSPSFDIQTGTADAFSSITAKISGMWMFFKSTKIRGYDIADVSKTWHIVPLSAGMETNKDFDILNAIVEVGWIPWYQSYAAKRPEWLRNTTVAFFLQGGYKFLKDTSGKIGGEVDQSKEKKSSGIVRLKGDVSANIFNPVQISVFRVGLVGGATVWYDVLNQAVYHKVDGDLRFFLTGNNDDFISLNYQHGSGAPLFNSGDQFGIGLVVSF
jgi:hypothetical protein